MKNPANVEGAKRGWRRRKAAVEDSARLQVSYLRVIADLKREGEHLSSRKAATAARLGEIMKKISALDVQVDGISQRVTSA